MRFFISSPTSFIKNLIMAGFIAWVFLNVCFTFLFVTGILVLHIKKFILESEIKLGKRPRKG